jgi:hypothetical protein
VEVRIGVQNAPREIVLESSDAPEKVEQTVTKALSSSSATLTLVDDKGRRVIVATDKVAYVEIAESDSRRVGFGAL